MRDRFGCAALAVLLIAAGGTGVEAQVSLSTYGYMSSRWEKAFDRPFVEDGRVLRDSGVAQFGQPAFDVAFKPKIGKRVRGYLSLAGDGRDVSVSKVWGEVEAHPLASVRVGPQYRRFGLYNEILHAAPTYYGVEAPELLDGDHLLIPRTTVFSLLGSMTLGAGSLEYALSVDEADVFDGAPPISWDVRYLFGGGDALIGLS